jgi:tRNA (cmo5U34)-methyltransferase
MRSELDRFNWIAGIYDWLTRFIFGKAFREAQIYFLKDIAANSTVVIIGGGTGWILRELLEVNAYCKVHYIEASEKMLKKSRAQISTVDLTRVKFIHGTEDEIDSRIKYDAVITNFFLDLFSNSLPTVVQKIKAALSGRSIWIVTEFVDEERLWHRTMLKIMYIFFRTTTGIEATRLPDYEKQLEKAGIKKSKEKLFFGSFIRSAVYSISE